MENKLGIVIRYSDSTEKDGIDTIAEHNELFKKVGTAFVGKFGQPARSISSTSFLISSAFNILFFKS